MGKLIDLTNQKFGLWTVLYKVPKNQSGSNWMCRCECGKEKIINGYNLRKGKTTNCGCIRGKQLSKNNIIDMTGKRFGNWTVISKSNKKGKSNVLYWKCKCDCGTIADVRGDILRNGTSQSCGCKRNYSRGEELITKILNENNINFIREKSFDSCRFPDTNYPAKFDFFVNNKYVIEFDGQQHFEKNIYNGSWDIKKVYSRDEYKNQWCFDNNIPIIRIPYTQLSKLKLQDLMLETSQFIVKKD